MTGSNSLTSALPALVAGGLLLAGAAVAQDRGSDRTRSLNTAPAESTLSTRPNVQPPLTAAERSQSSTPIRPTSADALEALLGATAEDDEPDAAEGVTLAPGETAPPPIPVSLGYYVRGDKECAEVWPGEGDLGFMTPTSFSIDFGGCEPGQFIQTGPNSWREQQRCRTELGGDGGGYVVDYEVTEAGKVSRSARLAADGSVEDDVWTFCETASVPQEARFR